MFFLAAFLVTVYGSFALMGPFFHLKTPTLIHQTTTTSDSHFGFIDAAMFLSMED